MRVQVRRVYDEPSPEDGMRILVDWLWPLAISKERLAFDQWAKGSPPARNSGGGTGTNRNVGPDASARSPTNRHSASVALRQAA